MSQTPKASGHRVSASLSETPKASDLRASASLCLSHLFRPVDAASLAAFRILFGLVMFAGSVRFLAKGWVQQFFVEPKFFFKYWGFSWVEVWPAWGAYAHFVLLAVLALLVTVGLWYRVAIALFFVAFTYADLMDASLYLNHHYLVSLLALLLALLPAHAVWSVDALRRPAVRRETVPAFTLTVLRFQVGLVYTCAGLAKLQSDWLLHGQPLGIWLASRTDLPLIGPLLAQPGVALAVSWAAFLFDSTIAFWLLGRRSRPFAFAAVVLFHLGTKALFPIGMFPFIMIVAATVFFSPAWPRRLVARLRRVAQPPVVDRVATPAPWQRIAVGAFAVYAAVQIAMPFRYLAYGGNVLWHEQGMRFSWRVMVREKNGSVTFNVRNAKTGREWVTSPREYLMDYQEREMGTQPELVWQLARHIARDFDRRGLGPVQVRAEALVSLNGRPAAPLVDPNVDLAAVGEGLAAKPWVLPAPPSPPLRMAALR